MSSFEHLRADLLGGCAAGLTQDMAMHPVDTIRARLDVSRAHTTANPASALLHEARAVLAADGVLGLYRGYGLAIIGSTPANALYFSSYQMLKRQLSSDGNLATASVPLRDLMCGFGAEVIAAGLWTPMDVLKQRLQVAPADLGVLGAVRAACEQTGLVGLWRGYTAGICVWGPFSSVYFATYEALRDAYGRERAGSNLYAGMGGGAAAALITQPLDCAKTRLQVGATAPGAWLFESMRDIFAKEGFRALMRGGIARALYLAPGCGISVTVFDLVSAALKPDHRS